MRASQLWHWIYVRGATDFADMLNISKELRAALERQFHRRPAGDRRRADLGRRHAQMAVPLPAARRRPPGRDRDRLHPRGRPRHALRLLAGRLHADLLVLPHRHAEAGAQPDGGRDPRRRCSSPATGSAISPDRDHAGRRDRARAEGRKVSNIVMMGMGEPLYNFDNVKKALLIASDGDGLALSQAPHHAVDLGRRAGNLPAPARRSASCWRSRCMRCATTCATCWCRSTRSIR